MWAFALLPAKSTGRADLSPRYAQSAAASRGSQKLIVS